MKERRAHWSAPELRRGIQRNRSPLLRDRLGKPRRLKIDPPCGHTAEEGHCFVFLSVPAWEPDVFAFFDERMRR